MAKPIPSEKWEEFKDTIQGLYQTHPLQTSRARKGHGRERGLVEIMKDRFDFIATPKQFERKIKEWGFRKNTNCKSWTEIDVIISKRKMMGKQTIIYYQGQFLSQKKVETESRRQSTHTTSVDRIYAVDGPTPRTPVSFDYCTLTYPNQNPTEYIFQALQSLPILKFQAEAGPFLQTIVTLKPDLQALSFLLPKVSECSKISLTARKLNAILPNIVFGQGLTIERYNCIDSGDFLNIAISLASNNFPAGSQSKEVLKSLKNHGVLRYLDALCDMRTPTAQALREQLFRLTVEAGDLYTVRHLLRAGVNPNGNQCRHIASYGTCTPLQYACLSRRPDMALDLLEFGAYIDESERGWDMSILVLAIFGFHRYPVAGNDTRSDFLTLIDALLTKGAKLNPTETETIHDKSYDMIMANPLDGCLSRLRYSQSPLTVAAYYTDKQLVDLFLAKGARVDYKTRQKTTALHEVFHPERFNDLPSDPASTCCFDYGSMEEFSVIRSLLDAGADVNANCGCPKVTFGRPLAFALVSGRDTVELLLEYGALITTEVWADVDENSDVEIVEYLLANAFDNALCNIGSPLPLEATNVISLFWSRFCAQTKVRVLHFSECCTLARNNLLLSGIRYNMSSLIDDLFGTKWITPSMAIVDSPGLRNAIESCCERGGSALKQVLILGGLHRTAILNSLGSSICYALKESHFDMVYYLISIGADVNVSGTETSYRKSALRGETALMLAISHRNEEMVLKLLDAGADVNRGSIKSGGCQCCNDSYACRNRTDTLVHAIEWGNPVVIQKVLESTADINARGRDARLYNVQFPLTMAIWCRNQDLVHQLLQLGANTNRSQSVESPLEVAAWGGDPYFVELLLQEGANPMDRWALPRPVIGGNEGILRILVERIKSLPQDPAGFDCDNIGSWALLTAILEHRLEMATILITANIVRLDPDKQNNDEPYERWWFFLRGVQWPDLKLLDSKYLPTPLQLAVNVGYRDTVKLLLHHGAKVDSTTSWSWPSTPLQMATQEGSKPIIDVLLENGADVNAPAAPDKGATALQYAAMQGYLGLVVLFVERDADVNAPPAETDGRTALEGAAEHGRIDIVKFLLDCGADIGKSGAGQYDRAFKRARLNGHFAVASLLQEHKAQSSPATFSGQPNGVSMATSTESHIFEDEIESVEDSELSSSEAFDEWDKSFDEWDESDAEVTQDKSPSVETLESSSSRPDNQALDGQQSEMLLKLLSANLGLSGSSIRTYPTRMLYLQRSMNGRMVMAMYR
ncbi:ankyrin [Rhizodiscina lignyota]|uniref:Ankyrin n=1 Tax=Rhizodiscina lignyota TaxID=1504668 RepID=A0A9P4IB92_9PEZI|nr:ankyrin [Rhizodiscina lignyota]